jgi:ABC-type Mn2+/Zn2+ transport system permease subunit
MVTSCIKHGRVKQEISLIEIAIIALIFIITGSMGTQVILDIQKNKRDICEQYVQYPSTIHVNYGVAYISCILISVVLFLIAGYKIIRIIFIDKNIKLAQFILPGLLLLIFAVTVSLSVVFYNSHLENVNTPVTTLNPSVDGKLLDYCSKKDTQTENLYIVFTFFFSLGLIGIFLYTYNFVTSICQSA